MRILLTNDDGIHADGLATLERIARTLSDEAGRLAVELVGVREERRARTLYEAEMARARGKPWLRAIAETSRKPDPPRAA